MPERLPQAHVDGWQLCSYDAAFWGTRQPPPAPTKEAELSSDPTWSSLYHEERIVASWYRHVPLSARERAKIGERYQAGRARGHR